MSTPQRPPGLAEIAQSLPHVAIVLQSQDGRLEVAPGFKYRCNISSTSPEGLLGAILQNVPALRDRFSAYEDCFIEYELEIERLKKALNKALRRRSIGKAAKAAAQGRKTPARKKKKG